jgi:hypothetical protein
MSSISLLATKLWFEEQDMHGRLMFLSALVRHANDVHVSIKAIGSGDAEHHIKVQEREILSQLERMLRGSNSNA